MFHEDIIQCEKDADQATEARKEPKDKQRTGHDFTEANKLGKNPEIRRDDRRQKIMIDAVRCSEAARHDRSKNTGRRHEEFGMRKFHNPMRKPKEADG